MRNCLILGSGRSGTSMIAGTLSKSGYFMGERLYPPRESNPKGFFEDPEINGINEALLAQVTPKRPPLIGQWFFRDRPTFGERWLARIPLGTKIPVPPNIGERIRRATRREPYCYKDPRFSYTLSAWRPYLKNTVFICVFRNPASTVASILKECQTAKYLKNFKITRDQALEVWKLMYSHILRIHKSEGEWLFLHYNQVLTGEGLDAIEAFLEAPVDRSFPDPRLRRSVSTDPVPEDILDIYAELCRLANYNGVRSYT